MIKYFMISIFFVSSAFAGSFLDDVQSATKKVKKVNRTASEVTRERKRTKKNIDDYTPDEKKKSKSSKAESDLDKRERKLREREKALKLRERELKLKERERKAAEREKELNK